MPQSARDYVKVRLQGTTFINLDPDSVESWTTEGGIVRDVIMSSGATHRINMKEQVWMAKLDGQRIPRTGEGPGPGPGRPIGP